MLKKLYRPLAPIILAGLIVLALGGAAPASAAVETTQPIRIVIIDSSDADFIAYVYGTVLSKLGYNVEYFRVDYSAQIAGLETGDLDVTTGIWDTTSWPQVVDTVNTGLVVNYGSTGVRVQEGWWYPRYMEKICPGLPDWKALRSEKCVTALATAETSPKGRYVDAPADWETIAVERMEALGLDYEVISSGSPVTLVATVKSAVDRGDPILSWGYRPHWFYDGVDGDFVQLPPNVSDCYDDPAWGVNPNAVNDCGYSVGFIWKLGSEAFGKRAPRAARILHLFALSTQDVAKATDRAENSGEDIGAIAEDWVRSNEAAWKVWIE